MNKHRRIRHLRKMEIKDENLDLPLVVKTKAIRDQSKADFLIEDVLAKMYMGVIISHKFPTLTLRYINEIDLDTESVQTITRFGSYDIKYTFRPSYYLKYTGVIRLTILES